MNYRQDLMAHVRLRLHSGHQVTTPFLLTNSLGYISFGVYPNVDILPNPYIRAVMGVRDGRI